MLTIPAASVHSTSAIGKVVVSFGKVAVTLRGTSIGAVLSEMTKLPSNIPQIKAHHAERDGYNGAAYAPSWYDGTAPMEKPMHPTDIDEDWSESGRNAVIR